MGTVVLSYKRLHGYISITPNGVWKPKTQENHRVATWLPNLGPHPIPRITTAVTPFKLQVMLVDASGTHISTIETHK